MSIIRNIKRYIINYKINKQIKKYKYIHLMFNDKFNKPFVDFLNKNFNPKEHLILCKNLFEEFPFPEGDNVIEIERLMGLDFRNSDKIICHSLFDNELVNYLYKHQDILKNKAYWAIWGGDLYNAPRDKKNDFVRSNFKGYWSVADEKLTIEIYGTNKNFHRISYIFPISKEMINNAKKLDKNYIKIQVNNSCDETTLEALEFLSKFKDENIKITTILSYGKMQYKDKIIQKGREIFGYKFEYVDKLLSAEDYTKHLAQNDILVLNQNRQQGVGNTLASLLLGNKVFIRSDIATYQFFNEQDITIYDSKAIKDMDFCKFIEHMNRNKTLYNVDKFFNEEYLTKLWKDAIYAK